MYSVYQKLIISGSFIEHYTYEKPYYIGYPQYRFSHRFRRQKNQEIIREDNVRRTRARIRRLINCNRDLQKFITLTFNTPTLTLRDANPLFHNFIKRLKRIFPDLKYCCVPEFQPISGRVHYHFLCNIDVFYFKHSLESLWGHGFCHITDIDNVDNVGAYICKYLGKGNFDTRYFVKRKFFYSLNLLRPVVVDKINDVLMALQCLPVHISSFVLGLKVFEVFTKWQGLIKYKQYKLDNCINVLSSLENLNI